LVLRLAVTTQEFNDVITMEDCTYPRNASPLETN
jgi:hypothetical protein